MTDIETTWQAVWDKLVEIVQGMSEFTGKASQVYYGTKFPPTLYPSAFVVPGEITGGPGTPVKEDWVLKFQIGLVIQKADMKAGLAEVMALALKLKRLIIADRHLTDNGSQLVWNTEVPSIIPNWGGQKGYEDHWAGVAIECSATTDS